MTAERDGEEARCGITRCNGLGAWCTLDIRHGLAQSLAQAFCYWSVGWSKWGRYCQESADELQSKRRKAETETAHNQNTVRDACTACCLLHITFTAFRGGHLLMVILAATSASSTSPGLDLNIAALYFLDLHVQTTSPTRPTNSRSL